MNLPRTDGRDVHHPMDEPNPAHIESSRQVKSRSGFFKLVHRFGAKFLPPRTLHRMSKCLGPTLVKSSQDGFNETE